MLLGAVADDITGATDLCLTLSREGMRTVQVMGLPAEGERFREADAIVVALKTRTIEPADAVAQSVAAARALLAAGARQLLFKYCSTFDSTDRGNIGPVAEALQDLVGCPLTIACPAFPAAGRTVYKGHLFVGDRLLSESPLKDHPLNPMHDPDLVRVLRRQATRPVGLVDWPIVAGGEGAVRQALDRLREAGTRLAVVDALSEADLRAIGAACSDMKLITGGSGIAMGLPANFRRSALLAERDAPSGMRAPAGKAVVLAGSCSVATRRQIEVAQEADAPTFRVEVSKILGGEHDPAAIAAWVEAHAGSRVPVVYSSVEPDELAAIQSSVGQGKAGAFVEETLARAGAILLSRGFTRFIVAGGETSGAVIAALGVKALAIGPEIDEGVPWTRSVQGPDVALALKSGNFGASDFFLRAWSVLDEGAGHA